MTIAFHSLARFSPLPYRTAARLSNPFTKGLKVRHFSSLSLEIPTKWDFLSSQNQKKITRLHPADNTEPPSAKKKPALTGMAFAVGGLAAYHILGEKSYSVEEIERHNSPEKGIWITYQKGVYDITRFVSVHPGGDVFAKVAGKAIDDDWAALPFHAKGPAKKMLHEMRIGKVKGSLSEREKAFFHALGFEGLFPSQGTSKSDPYANEPSRNNQLTVRDEKPYNADPSLKNLSKSFITPKEQFYVRNHYPIPEIDRETYRLHMMIGGKNFVFSIEDLKKNYPQISVSMVQACAGNKRASLQGTNGTPWEAAVGNVCYEGPRLFDVLSNLLKEQELDEEYLADIHLYITGMDHSPSGTHYNTSIAWNKIPHDALLAHSMNGEELTPDHGFPLRVVFPGLSGHYSVKFPEKMMFVHRSRIEKEEAFEKSFPEDLASDLSLSRAQRAYVKYDEQNQILGFAGKLPVQSQILDVSLSQDHVLIKGYAHGESGEKLNKIEVSFDGGKNWKKAEIEKHDAKANVQKWAWSFWNLKISRKDLPADCDRILSRAQDKAGNIQPENPEFNKRGLGANAWGTWRLDSSPSSS